MNQEKIKSKKRPWKAQIKKKHPSAVIYTLALAYYYYYKGTRDLLHGIVSSGLFFPGHGSGVSPGVVVGNAANADDVGSEKQCQEIRRRLIEKIFIEKRLTDWCLAATHSIKMRGTKIQL